MHLQSVDTFNITFARRAQSSRVNHKSDLFHLVVNELHEITCYLYSMIIVGGSMILVYDKGGGNLIASYRNENSDSPNVPVESLSFCK